MGSNIWNGWLEISEWERYKKESDALSSVRKKDCSQSYLRQLVYPLLLNEFIHLDLLSFHRSVRQLAKVFNKPRFELYKIAGLVPLAHKLSADIQGFLGLKNPSGLNSAIRGTFARRIGLHQRINFQRPPANPDPRVLIREEMIGGLTDGLFEFAVNTYDKTASPYQVEQRYPFFDRRLMEFCLAIPYHFKMKEGWTRVIFRKAMEQILPSSIQWRVGKGNLGAGVRLGYLNDQLLIEDAVMNGSKNIGSFVDRKKLKKAYDEFIKSPMNSSDEILFTLMLSTNLSIWLEKTGLA